MLAVSTVLLFLFSFIMPIVVFIFLIDQKRNSVKPFIIGVLTYIIAESCIKLPLLGLFGYGDTINIAYRLLLSTAAAIFIEVIQYFVIKSNLKKYSYSFSKLIAYSAGYILANIFIVWGIDSVSTAAVVIFDNFKLIEITEIFNEIIIIFITIPIRFGLVLLCANAIKYKQALYFLLVIIVNVLTNTDLVFAVCNKLTLGAGVGILYLAIICVIIIMFIKKQIFYWKGKNNEQFETNTEN